MNLKWYHGVIIAVLVLGGVFVLGLGDYAKTAFWWTAWPIIGVAMLAAFIAFWFILRKYDDNRKK